MSRRLYYLLMELWSFYANMIVETEKYPASYVFQPKDLPMPTEEIVGAVMGFCASTAINGQKAAFEPQGLKLGDISGINGCQAQLRPNG